RRRVVHDRSPSRGSNNADIAKKWPSRARLTTCSKNEVLCKCVRSGGGRGIRTPKGLAARWISSPLPCQLRLALRLPNSLSYYHYLTNRLTRPPPSSLASGLCGSLAVLCGRVVDCRRVRIRRQCALGPLQRGRHVAAIDDVIPVEHRTGLVA